MAVIQKTLFAKNLDRYTTLVNDTETNSKYFKVTELPDTLTGGKNAFLVAGSKELVPDTKIQIELKDAAGNIIYHEPGEGYISSSLNGVPFVTEYYEGVSKVVSVYIYPDTAYGPCTLTILGELSEYTDANGIVTPVGLDWENKYNVKWTKTINVNPALANTTKIRFYQRPTAAITEILSPIYSIVGDNKVASNVTQSFANIKLSKLETFAGDVKRVKVFRTSQGDISDYDLIQDILIESKELLTSYELSGSVVGETGILTSETLKNNWNTGSLNAFLTSSRVESGVRLTGSGNFTYTSSLDIKTANTYELNLDAFYSSSISSNLGIYLSQVTTSGDGITPTTISSSIATLVGTQPTKNLLDTVIPFKLDRNYPSASLYFSQSQGEWHLGNISLKLSQDTAFSPDEISFVTTMPTVLGNETYNFKFEFYDVNNNYVPVAVTQSALFTGGNNNINGTLTLISSSASGSLADLNRVSSSISGTIVVTSGSVNTLSGSVSSSLGLLSSSVSSSNAIILSSSLSKVQQLANGQFSGSFIGDTFIYSPTIGGQQGYISELFKVGTSPSIYLDARQNPRKIFIGGVSDSGSYNNTNTNVYLDSTGKFSLGNKLTFDGTNLSVNGSITITNPSTANNGGAVGSFSNGDALTGGSIAGVTIASTKIYIGTGTHNNSNTAFYVDNTGKFSLKDKLSWDGTNLSVNGSITITNPSTANNGGAVGSFSNGDAITGGSIAGVTIASTKIYIGTGTHGNSNTGFYVDNTGKFSLKDKLVWDGTTLSIIGNVTIGSTALTEANTLNSNTTAGNVGLGNVENLSAQNQAQTGLIAGTTITGGGITLSGGGNIKGGQTAYNTGTGFFLGYSGTDYKFSIGNASTKGITWDGSTLSIGGDVTIGATLASTVVSNAAAVSGKISTGGAASDVNSGVTKISGGQIVADSITATQISGLNFTGKTATFNQGTIGGWELASTRLKSTDSITRLDSTNKEFAVMDPSNLNYYKVRIGAGTTFQSQPFHPFTEINESGIKVGGIVDTGGNGLSANLQGYNDTANSNTGVAVSVYSSINYTTNQYVPIYARIFENNSGVSSGVAAGQFVGGIIARNTTTPGASDAINQGFAIITDGHNYFGGEGKTTQITNQLYLSGLVLNPSSPGVNSFIKVVDSTGYAFRSSSSRKTKNIYGNWKIDGVLENIKKVPVERFKYKKWDDDEVETFGLIAEDLHNNEFWQAVTYDADKDGRAIYEEEKVSGIDYEKITSILWKAVQELTEKVELLEIQIKNK